MEAVFGAGVESGGRKKKRGSEAEEKEEEEKKAFIERWEREYPYGKLPVQREESSALPLTREEL